jgi:hypothetical protein
MVNGEWCGGAPVNLAGTSTYLWHMLGLGDRRFVKKETPVPLVETAVKLV